MGNATSKVLNPFELNAPEEDVEMNALVTSLQIANGFTLLFGICNQAKKRHRLVQKACKKLSGVYIVEISLYGQTANLLDLLREELIGLEPQAVFVYGLEHSVPTEQGTPIIANLNASRNSFSKVVPCPLVFWIPEYVLTAITLNAPDFFSIRSGVYSFVQPSEQVKGRERISSTEDVRLVELLSIQTSKQSGDKSIHLSELWSSLYAIFDKEIHQIIYERGLSAQLQDYDELVDQAVIACLQDRKIPSATGLNSWIRTISTQVVNKLQVKLEHELVFSELSKQDMVDIRSYFQSQFTYEDFDEDIIKQSLIDTLRTAVTHLPGRERVVVTLILQGSTLDEIATLLGLSSRTVYVLRHHAFQRLRDNLQLRREVNLR